MRVVQVGEGVESDVRGGRWKWVVVRLGWVGGAVRLLRCAPIHPRRVAQAAPAQHRVRRRQRRRALPARALRRRERHLPREPIQVPVRRVAHDRGAPERRGELGGVSRGGAEGAVRGVRGGFDLDGEKRNGR